MRLGELLVQFGAVSREQLATAMRRQEALGGGGRITTQLVEMGFITEDALTSLLAQKLQIGLATPAALESIAPAVVTMLKRDEARRHGVCPVRLDGKRLYVAMVDPTDKELIAELVKVTNHDVRPLAVTETALGYALDKYYPARQMIASVTLTGAEGLDQMEIEPLSDGIHKLLTPQAIQQEIALGGQGYQPQPSVPQAYPVAAPSGRVSRPTPMVLPGQQAELAARAVAPQRASLADFGAWLLSSTTQPELFAAMLGFIARDFGRVVMLALRDGYLCGWRARGQINEQAVRELAVEPAAIPVVARLVEDQQPRLGRAAPTTLGPLADVVGAPGEQAMLLLPALYADHVIGAFIALDGREGVEQFFGEYTAAVEKLDFALRMLELRDRILS